LLVWQAVTLMTPVGDIISRAGHRVLCERCGEEIINEREVTVKGQVLCRACAGQRYYRCRESQFDLVTEG
jgi:formylmethanofuran dehydrogenase subunit E